MYYKFKASIQKAWSLPFMVINSPFTDKIIVIAEHDIASAQNITEKLKETGFQRIIHADSGIKFIEILNSYQYRREQIGVAIINEKLPECQIREIFLSYLYSSDNTPIPFIVLSQKKRQISDYLSSASSHPQYSLLIKTLQFPVNFHELALIIDFQLGIKYERLLRHKQEKLLLNELTERKAIDKKLQYLIAHDELTGLYNRHNFEQKLRILLSARKNKKLNCALLFIDIDRFSMINELEDFEVGDQLLMQVVRVMQKHIDNDQLFARIGSDEFSLLLENHTELEATQFASNLKKAVEEFRFFTGEICYSVTISIGISTLGILDNVFHPNELVLRARQACHTAKENGRNMLWVFNNNDKLAIERRKDIYWAPLIKRALVSNELFLVYQPVVKLTNGVISHYEALIRMKGENNLIIPPSDFIPAAERMGLIHNIDLWVIETALDFLAQLPKSLQHISVAVNLSGSSFQDTALLPTVKAKLLSTQVNASRLTFEITETAAVEHYEKAREMIIKIRSLGCKFALDDFGAGFCSFNYLKCFPVDFVKIDGQFIQNLISDETDQILVRSMTEVANQLGKSAIAEYVESPTVVEKLLEYGIEYGQGYFFGKPQAQLLKSNSISIENLIRTAL